MPTIFTAQTGVWNAADTWVGGVIPVSGDSVIGYHNIDVPSNYTAEVGSGLTQTALYLDNTCKLTVFGHLRIHGNTLISGTSTRRLAVELKPGARLGIGRFDIGVGAVRPYLLSSGTSSQRNSIYCIVENSGHFKSQNVSAGQLSAYYTDFSGVGSRAVSCIQPWYQNTTDSCDIHNCNFYRCGYFFNAVTAFNFSFLNNQFYETLTALSFSMVDASSNSASYSIISGNYFDRQVNLASAGYTRILNNVFENNLSWTGQLSTYNTYSFNDNVLCSKSTAVGATVIIEASGSTNNYYMHSSNADNPHGISIVNTPTTRPWKMDSWILEYDGNSAVGDMIIPNSSSGLIINCILIPGNSGGSCGTLISLLGNANSQVSIENNTYVSTLPGEQGVKYGETYPGYTGIIKSFRNNIAWAPPGKSGLKLAQVGTGSSACKDGAYAADCECNVIWNPSDSSDGHGYATAQVGATLFSNVSGTPGIRDFTCNPEFVDYTRRFRTWAETQGQQASFSGGLLALRANPSSGAFSLINWVRAGFAPQNPLLRQAGYNGRDIGAVSGIFASGFIASGPTEGNVASASTFSITPIGGQYNSGVTFSGTLAGTFTPSLLTWASGNDTKTFTYTPSVEGEHLIWINNYWNVTNPNVLTLQAGASLGGGAPVGNRGVFQINTSLGLNRNSTTILTAQREETPQGTDKKSINVDSAHSQKIDDDESLNQINDDTIKRSIELADAKSRSINYKEDARTQDKEYDYITGEVISEASVQEDFGQDNTARGQNYVCFPQGKRINRKRIQ
jgi:hypothetical protein